ncbi:protein kinase [Streptomyces sp. NBC_01789]|uniref:protein kinase domain-containing protein n=1 Tax=Streptomyces sp. NBC_01789 TaxID=2975941 RepID=UPI00224DAF3A|nr:protein kinase [Streptomyces sp. NBC_01789]MCX4451598.1 protein kinase [Streptomyces sp. NBC_01789]
MARVNYRDGVPGWRDLGPLSEDPKSNKQFVRRVEHQATGEEAVLKHRSAAPTSARGTRFHDEAVMMRRFTDEGIAGVLPVLDIDAGDEPAWYVMPKARLLQSVFVDTTTLQDIVGHSHALAKTLCELAGREFYHRDIKPDNLFWYDGRPVLADFGIAYFGGASVTVEGEKLGPLWFMAPEMRSVTKREAGGQADVYSLAQTLSAFIHPLGKLPLPGTFRAGAMDYDLNVGWKGDHDALDALEHVLEAATRNDPYERLRIDGLEEELRLWLHSAKTPLVKNTGYRTGWGPEDDHVRDETEVRRVMRRTMYRITRPLDDVDPMEHDIGDEERPRWLATYGWPHNSDDGFEPDGVLTFSAPYADGARRVVLGAVYYGREVSFIAEIHRAEAGEWHLEHSWPETDWGRIRLPSASHSLQALADEVVRSFD